MEGLGNPLHVLRRWGGIIYKVLYVFLWCGGGGGVVKYSVYSVMVVRSGMV